MNDQTTSPAGSEDAERALYEKHAWREWGDAANLTGATGAVQGWYYFDDEVNTGWMAWRASAAARRAPALDAAIPSNSGELDAAGLPALPLSALHFRIGFDYYTAEQVRQAQRDAYELGRIEGRRDQHETHVTLLGQNLKLRAQLAQKGKP